MNRVEVSSCWRSGIHFWAFLDYWSDVLVFIGCILFSGGVDDQCGKLVFETKSIIGLMDYFDYGGFIAYVV